MCYKIIMTLFFVHLFGNMPIRHDKADTNAQVVLNKSGVYSSVDRGQITISINNGVLTGVYEYYDKWNENYKEYMDINIVYIYGYNSNGLNYKITSISPGNNEIINGVCDFTNDYKTLRIVLKDQPPGYASFDFTKDTKDNLFSLKSSNKFSGVRIVKSKKTALYDYDGQTFIKRKAYLVKGDIVTLLDSLKEYSKISYHSFSTDKTNMYWINHEDLYEANPELWKK